jgi:hypothetical protein
MIGSWMDCSLVAKLLGGFLVMLLLMDCPEWTDWFMLLLLLLVMVLLLFFGLLLVSQSMSSSVVVDASAERCWSLLFS